MGLNSSFYQFSTLKANVRDSGVLDADKVA